MEATITSVRENPLLNRREVEVELAHEGEETPSKEDVQNRVAAENDLDTEKVEVQSIYTGYGKKTSRATLKIYDEFEYDEELEKDPVEEAKEEQVESKQDFSEYEDLVSGTITEAKNALKEMDNPDYDAALKAEKDNKNRTTLIDWLESQ